MDLDKIFVRNKYQQALFVCVQKEHVAVLWFNELFAALVRWTILVILFVQQQSYASEFCELIDSVRYYTEIRHQKIYISLQNWTINKIFWRITKCEVKDEIILYFFCRRFVLFAFNKPIVFDDKMVITFF